MRTVARGQIVAGGGDRPSFSAHTCVVANGTRACTAPLYSALVRGRPDPGPDHVSMLYLKREIICFTSTPPTRAPMQPIASTKQTQTPRRTATRVFIRPLTHTPSTLPRASPSLCARRGILRARHSTQHTAPSTQHLAHSTQHSTHTSPCSVHINHTIAHTTAHGPAASLLPPASAALVRTPIPRLEKLIWTPLLQPLAMMAMPRNTFAATVWFPQSLLVFVLLC